MERDYSRRRRRLGSVGAGQQFAKGDRLSRPKQSLFWSAFAPLAVWALCGSYYQAGLMDGGGSSFKMRIGGREKSVGEYGDVAPSIFREVELLVDAAAKSCKKPFNTQILVPASFNEFYPKYSGPTIDASSLHLPSEHSR